MKIIKYVNVQRYLFSGCHRSDNFTAKVQSLSTLCAVHAYKPFESMRDCRLPSRSS